MVKGVMGGPRGCKFRARARGALGGRRPVRGRWLLERKREGAVSTDMARASEGFGLSTNSSWYSTQR